MPFVSSWTLPHSLDVNKAPRDLPQNFTIDITIQSFHRYLLPFSKMWKTHFHILVFFFSICHDCSIWLLTKDHRHKLNLAIMVKYKLPCLQIQILSEQRLAFYFLTYCGLHACYIVYLSLLVQRLLFFLEKTELK